MRNFGCRPHTSKVKPHKTPSVWKLVSSICRGFTGCRLRNNTSASIFTRDRPKLRKVITARTYTRAHAKRVHHAFELPLAALKFLCRNVSCSLHLQGEHVQLASKTSIYEVEPNTETPYNSWDNHTEKVVVFDN